MSAEPAELHPKRSIAFPSPEREPVLSTIETPRVLLVSSVGLTVSGITSVRWDQHVPNPADFDVVILDIISLREHISYYGVLPSGMDDLDRDRISQLLWSKGLVLCLTPPIEGFGDKFETGRRSPYWWSPIPLENVVDSGTTRRIHEPRLKRYFDRGVSTWRSYVRVGHIPASKQKTFPPIVYDVRPLVSARYNVALAGIATAQEWSGVIAETLRPGSGTRSGPIVVLPEPDLIPVGEAIQIVLEDLVGFAVETPPPSWTSATVFPGEESIRQEIGDLDKTKRDLEDRIEDARARLQGLEKHKRLLYEHGAGLEQAVWTALERLGAVVHPSAIPGREDRWFEVPGTGEKAAMEVKGHLSGMSTTDARQADDWTSEILARTNEAMKGVLFGNPFRDQPPDKRPEPWPPDVIRYATKRGLALVTTSQLYDVLVRSARGKLKPSDFFQAVFRTDGPVRV